MRVRRSWWQQIKKHPVSTVLIALLAVVIFLVILGGYKFNWDWTGFNRPSKTLWDWLQLLGVLAVPVVVGFGAVWFTTRQGKVADAENKDNQRENALQEYIREMSELLLHENLRESAEGDEVRTIGRVRTLTILPRLDEARKGTVIQFLYESQLIKDNNIIILEGADLSGADLNRANLNRANLSGANLRLARLQDANLSKVDLSGADLSGADLSAILPIGRLRLGGVKLYGADLNRADLSRAEPTRSRFERSQPERSQTEKHQPERSRSERSHSHPVSTR